MHVGSFQLLKDHEHLGLWWGDRGEVLLGWLRARWGA